MIVCAINAFALVGFEELLYFVQNDAVMCVIARRALPDVAISSKPTSDNVDSVLPLRRFFTSFRMTAVRSE